MTELKDEIKSGKPVFQDLLKKYLVENTHRVRAEAIPDATLESKQQAEEKAKFEKIKKSLTKEQIESVSCYRSTIIVICLQSIAIFIRSFHPAKF